MTFLSRKLILLAILLYEQYKYYTHTSLPTNTQYLSAQQYAYQSFVLLPGLIPFASKWRTGLISDKNVYINMSNSCPTTMYKSIFAQQYVFQVEK